MNRSEKNVREEPDTPTQLLASLADQCSVELKPSGYGRLIGFCRFHGEHSQKFWCRELNFHEVNLKVTRN